MESPFSFVTHEKNQFDNALVLSTIWLLAPENGTVKDGGWEKESSLTIAMLWKRWRATHWEEDYYDISYFSSQCQEGTTAWSFFQSLYNNWRKGNWIVVIVN